MDLLPGLRPCGTLHLQLHPTIELPHELAALRDARRYRNLSHLKRLYRRVMTKKGSNKDSCDCSGTAGGTDIHWVETTLTADIL